MRLIRFVESGSSRKRKVIGIAALIAAALAIMWKQLDVGPLHWVTAHAWRNHAAAARSGDSRPAPRNDSYSVTNANFPTASIGDNAHIWLRPSARSIASRSGNRLIWTNVLIDGDLLWVARQFSLSTDPDDWYKAALLEVLCIGTGETPEHRAQIDDLWPETRHLRRLTGERCGALSERAFIVQPPGSSVTARAAGSQLAIAPMLLIYEPAIGVSEEAASALRHVLSDATLAPAWLTMNHAGLISTLSATPSFAPLSFEEKEAAYFLALCDLGGGCDEADLYSYSLCLHSWQAMCSPNGVRASIAEWVPSNRQAAVRNAADALGRAVASSDLEALGLRVAPR